jgi:hypothetical protein
VNPLFAAALELQSFFEARRWRFCFIGGLAVQRWRHHLDVDAIWREMIPLLELKEDAETPSRLRGMLTIARGLR